MKKSLFYRSSVLFASLLISACSTIESVEQKTQHSIECLNAAKYARSIGVLKEAGIPYSSIEEYMTNPVVTTMPMRTIQFYSIGFKGNPGELYESVLNICEKDTWVSLEKELKGKMKPPIGELKITTTIKELPPPPILRELVRKNGMILSTELKTIPKKQ
jgi:hypothetical protein